MATRIATATAAGDVAALSALAIDLAQEVATLKERAMVLEARRFRDAERKRNRPRKSAELHGNPQTSADSDGTPSPQVSLLSPTPPNNPSFPPPPLPPLQAPQGGEEQRLHERAPEAWPVVVRFLDGKEPAARMAWIGRFHGALDRPPHPTGAELRDALEDLMTTPREKWVPTLFRRYVERIRRDADRAKERAAAPLIGPAVEADASRVFGAIRALVREVPNPGRGMIRTIPKAEVAKLGAAALAAYEQIGGADRFLDPEEKVGFLLRDFERAYRAQTPHHAGAA